MAERQPIGVFDSGVGGLSVLREIRALLPAEDLLYCADSGHAPYGEKPQAQIQARSLELCEFMVGQGAKALVIACNTATAAAATVIRERWPQMPVIGMEPAVKPATEATRCGVVGVLATTGTIKSARFAALLDHFGHGVRVVTRPGKGLVERVEQGDFSSPELRVLLSGHLAALTDAGVDVIVLGCTHYVFLRGLAQEIVGPEVRLIDTGLAVARQLQRKLDEHGLLAEPCPLGQIRFWSSGGSGADQALQRLWPGCGEPARLPPSVCMARA